MGLLLALAAGMALPAGADGPGRPLAVVGVSVVPMDTPRVLEDHTVVVTAGRITALGPAEDVVVPGDARVVAGDGRFLMPGLADMHVHLRHGSDEYLNYVTHGITTVMHLGGSAIQGARILEHRTRIEAGELLGPNIYATRRIFDGDPPLATIPELLAVLVDARMTVIPNLSFSFTNLLMWDQLEKLLKE